MLFGILGASLLGNILAGTSVIHTALYVVMTGKVTIRARENIRFCVILILVLKFKDITLNLSQMMFIQKIHYRKKIKDR